MTHGCFLLSGSVFASICWHWTRIDILLFLFALPVLTAVFLSSCQECGWCSCDKNVVHVGA